MPTNAYAQYYLAGGSTNAGRADDNYDFAGTPIQAKSGEEYYDFNGLSAVENKTEWFTTVNGETKWIPGLINNGCEFVRYAIWNGNCWQASYSEEQIVYPTSVTSSKWAGNNSNAFVDLPATPVGTTSAIALVGTMRYGTIQLPSGWTLLGETMVGTGAGTAGGSGYIRKAYAVAINEVVGTESLRFNFSNELGDTYNMKCYSYAYFSGGSKGTWNAVKGPEYTATSYAGFADVPLLTPPRLWWQTGIATGLYNNISSDVTSDHTILNNGFMEVYTKPAIGSASGEGFRTRYLTGFPATSSNYTDYDNIGAYGQPNSTSWAFYWVPDGEC